MIRFAHIQRSTICNAAVVLLLVNVTVLAQDKDPWAPFQFLLGNWSGLGSGQPGETSSGSTTFSYELDKRIIVRKSRTEFAPKPGEQTGMVHEDLLVIYRQTADQQFRAVYFDNEGHVINYSIAMTASQPGLVFESDAVDQGPCFRMVYESVKDGVLAVEFFIAPPGGEFKSYIKGIIERK